MTLSPRSRAGAPIVQPATARLVAAAALALNGAFVVVLAGAIGVTRALVAGGLAISPADMSLLEDLVAVLPFIAGFGITAVVAAWAVAVARPWAQHLGIGVAAVGATGASIGLLLMGVGLHPVFTTDSSPGPSDGLGILSFVLTLHLAAIVAIAIASRGERAARLAR